MDVKIEQVNISINQREANSIINALLIGTEKGMNPPPDGEDAMKLLRLLQDNFMASTRGTNYL